MELVDYVRVLRRRALLILVAMLACAGGAVLGATFETKVYTSAGTFLVPALANGASVDEVTGRQLAAARAKTLASFGSTPPAVQAALEQVGAGGGAGVSVTTSAEDGSGFLNVSVTSSDKQLAFQVAMAYAETLPATVARLSGASEQVAPLTALSAPGVPSSPSAPDPVRKGAIGLAIGLLLGLGVSFLKEALDRTIKDPDALEDTTKVTVLGSVPLELPKVELPIITHPGSTRAEAYRQVRTNIQFAGPEHTLKKLVITSATPGEGKTSVAANLAVAFARTGQTVALVDADMRRPRVAGAFGLSPSAKGLAELLTQDLLVDDLLQEVPGEPRIAVLTAGSVPSNPSELLGSLRMAALLDELGELFDVVLIDTPPVLPVTDPLVLAVNATGVVMVVRLGVTSRERLKRALANINKLNVPLLGMVANGSVATGDAAYAYQYGYSGYASRGRIDEVGPQAPSAPGIDVSSPNVDGPLLSPPRITGLGADASDEPASRTSRPTA